MADLPGVSVSPGSPLDDDGLAAVYGVPPGTSTWLRTNFAASLDGGITGGDGRSGSVNTAADHVVFELLRALSDVLLVGAGTLRNEGYEEQTVATRWAPLRAAQGLHPRLPVVAVSRQGAVPPTLLGSTAGSVLMATCEQAPKLAETREQLGPDNVLVHGPDAVDLASVRDDLAARGLARVICEGGPSLMAALLDAGLVDEVCLSVTPVVVGGDGPRMLSGASRSEAYHPVVLVEEDGTVMGRWMRAEVNAAR